LIDTAAASTICRNIAGDSFESTRSMRSAHRGDIAANTWKRAHQCLRAWGLAFPHAACAAPAAHSTSAAASAEVEPGDLDAKSTQHVRDAGDDLENAIPAAARVQRASGGFAREIRASPVTATSSSRPLVRLQEVQPDRTAP